jgi:predicted nucleotidyltransferase
MRDSRLPADLDARLATLGAALAQVPGVVFVYAFGSAATGKLGPTSDVDLAVFFEGREDLVEARLEAIQAAALHLGTDALDLIVLNEAPTSLLARILPVRRVLLDRVPFRRHLFESLEGRKAVDFRIFERRFFAARNRRGR